MSFETPSPLPLSSAEQEALKFEDPRERAALIRQAAHRLITLVEMDVEYNREMCPTIMGHVSDVIFACMEARRRQLTIGGEFDD